MASFRGVMRASAPFRPPARRVLAFALSLALHAALLWRAAPVPLPPSASDQPRQGAMRGELRARLASPSTPPAPPPAREARPSAPAPAPPARATPKAAPRPAREPAPTVPTAPSAERPQPPRIEGASPTLASPPREAAAPRESAPQDMSAMIEARRRAREAAEPARMAVPEPAPPGVEDEAARRERAVAANLGTLKAPSPGENQRRGGGVFQMRRVGTEEAAFLFFGWNRDMGRNNTQQIEVRRGANANIELAVVRRMIAIIREYESGDFLWQSQRLGRSVTLSARAADNASLEAFMLREFF